MNRVILLILISSLGSLVGCATNQQRSETPPIDRVSDAELSRIMLKPSGALSLDEIVKMSKDGVAPEQIIDKIKASNSYYDLTPSQTVQLSKQGVSTKVLDYIYESREAALKNNIAEEINKRERAKKNAERQLDREQNFYYPYGYGYPYWGSQFYWGPSIYYRHRR
jgi:S-formylglutathione hydrolase FrmB